MTASEWKADDHRADWRAGLEILTADGWRAHLTCAAAPVQVEGRLPTGDPFYFRARHSNVCLAVGGFDPADTPLWEQCEPHPDASYLPAGAGLEIMRRLAKAYGQAGADRSP